jgi:hypothetical protein
MSTLQRLLLSIPLALAMLVGTPAGSLRFERETEEAPVPTGEEAASSIALPSSARLSRRARHSLEQHVRARVCIANHRHPASSCAGPRYLAKDGHRLANGLRAPLLT